MRYTCRVSAPCTNNDEYSIIKGDEENMETGKSYTLPKLPYGYKALAPYISEEQLTLHHLKHHQAYVTGANALLEKFDKARKDNADLDMKATLKELSFHIGGYQLHKKFFENLAPSGAGGGGVPKGELAKAIDAEFGKFDRFKKEFTQAASGVEGSGWAVLTYCMNTGRLLIMQYPGCFRCRRIGLGSADVLYEYRAAAHHAT